MFNYLDKEGEIRVGKVIGHIVLAIIVVGLFALMMIPEF